MEKQRRKHTPEHIEKRRAKLLELYEEERRREELGLERLTKLRIGRQPPAKSVYLSRLRQKGYIQDSKNPSIFYYESEDLRYPKTEKNAPKHGITILSYQEKFRKNEKKQQAASLKANTGKSNPNTTRGLSVLTDKPSRSRMVVLNKLARQALDNAISSSRINSNSSLQAMLVQALVHLNFIFDVKKDRMKFVPKDLSLDEWSVLEIVTADAVHWLLACLAKMQCKNIDKLIRDVSDYRERHPDYPNGTWPYVKPE